MHQPYYKDLLTNESALPWVRLHGTKDYLDMVKIVGSYPDVHMTFNLVPSLLEQVEDYAANRIKDKFLELSFKPANTLSMEEKAFMLENFFSINKETVISFSPRYYELYLKREKGKAGEFTEEDFLDLQVWFNLAWTDPYFCQGDPRLKSLIAKGRFFTEEEKRIVLDKQQEILREVIPAYKKAVVSGQVEVTVSPYYHPILPLLYNTNVAREANKHSILPKIQFAYPQDAVAQIKDAAAFYEQRFERKLQGMWPSEEGVSEHILPYLIKQGIGWIVTDEAILFKSLRMKRRDTRLLYQPHLLRRKGGRLNVLFRDRNLSDLIGFVYHRWKAEVAVTDFIRHLENINAAFKDRDTLVTVAMDGENAWEYYVNDGHDFLNLLYSRLSEAKFLKAVTVGEYLKGHPAQSDIPRLAAGSWIYGEFSKWINNPLKNKAWEYLALARAELKAMQERKEAIPELAWKQIYVAEGSDWFWWFGDNQMDFDRLFRLHLSNFYTIIGKPVPEYLAKPITT